MKRICIAGVCSLVLFVCLAQAQSVGNKSLSSLRELSGQVVNRGDMPLPQAVVYLKNTKTLAVKTYIADDNGNYRFPGLSPNIDYEVSAESKGKRSATKTLSSFDSRARAVMNLKIDTSQ
jgi:hypothetical protein